jgi:hypothetical protein
MDETGNTKVMIVVDSTCPMCHIRPADPATRADYRGRRWCQECQGEFDSIDWYEVAAETERDSFA